MGALLDMTEGLKSCAKVTEEDEAKVEKVEGDIDLPENDNVQEVVGSVMEQDVLKEERLLTDGLGRAMCGEKEVNVGGSMVLGLTAGRKRSGINCEENSGDGACEKKRVKKETVGDKLLFVGRVLRPRTVNGLVEKKEYHDIEENKEVMANGGINEEANRCDGVVVVKRKRGRPPKSSMKEKVAVKIERNGQSGDESKCQTGTLTEKRKRGRPFKDPMKKRLEKKTEGDEQSGGNGGCQMSDNYSSTRPKRKCGRPPKFRASFNTEDVKKEERNAVGSNSSKSPLKRSVLKKSNLKVPNSATMSDEKEVCNVRQSTGDPGIQRSHKQAVREKIVKMLLAAGWTVDYRPRNGRDYNDAVYVNPEGRTHWSVTLAYRVLKEHYENSVNDSNNSITGFTFTPLPEDELNLLTKVIGKVRSDKNKKKKKWKKGEKKRKGGEEIINGKRWTGKLPKKRLGVLTGRGGKSSKRGPKLKKSRAKHDDCTDISEDDAAKCSRGRKRLETQDRKRCGLVARSSNNSDKSSGDGYVLYNGKRSVLSWMIDLGTVQRDGMVHCLEGQKTQAVCRGRILQDGIHCDCCGEAFTVFEFERHSSGKSCQPFGNIYLENGSSLLQCLLESWNKLEEPVHKAFHFVDIRGEDPNDDTCGICGDGGDLICCDSCPSTFHQSCLDIKRFPSGPWHCLYCSCKLCGLVSTDSCQKNDSSDATSSLVTCCLCEEKYHVFCVQSEDAASDAPADLSFCGKKCQKLYEGVHSLLGVKHDLEDDYSWTIVRRFDISSDTSIGEMHKEIQCNSKVAVAWLVMDECFLPMDDHRTGSNLIRNVVYNFGSNFNRLNYSGFLTAILDKGDETVAAASIRIHGNNLAEMPFIGTRYTYRRQGMCRRLLSGIEKALRSLSVEKLVIPAISELRETWTSMFGFEPVEGLSKKEMKRFNMITFPGVDMLQKPLLQHQLAKDIVNHDEGLECVKLNGCQLMDDEARNPEEFPTGFDLNDLNEPIEVTLNPQACMSNGHSISAEVALVSEQVK